MNTKFGLTVALALLMGMLMAALGMASVASASNAVQESAAYVPLSTAEKAALHEAIAEEYLARDTYQFVLTRLGTKVTPFSQIAVSEQQHVDTLAALFKKYGLVTPSDPGLAVNPVFADRKAACQIGVDAEKHDIALYDRLLAAGEIKHADLVQVFKNLRAASVNNHLPAFDGCN